jgi:hypothetical protein
MNFTTVNISNLLADFLISYQNFTWVGPVSDEAKVRRGLLLAGLSSPE